jgi:hypothetical protein
VTPDRELAVDLYPAVGFEANLRRAERDLGVPLDVEEYGPEHTRPHLRRIDDRDRVDTRRPFERQSRAIAAQGCRDD